MRYLAPFLALALCACTTATETAFPRTATEQLLIGHAAERAALKLRLDLPTGSKVYLDASRVSGEGSAYLIGCYRAELARRGARLVELPQADVVVELRSAALSMDQLDTVFGLPPMNLPAPNTMAHTLSTVTTPEISLYSTHRREGVAELSALALDAHTGTFIASAGPSFATSTVLRHRLLTALTWGKQQARPDR